MKIDWAGIDTVFLDMDGTLLDLHFDNHFWLEHVPRRYAEARGIPVSRARDEIHARYRDAEGTLAWYCVDHWSRELGLDIALLKAEVDHLIRVHPHVTDFLDALARAGKARVMVTNAHQKALALKLERTRLSGCFDAVCCAHDLGLPKEDVRFWDVLLTRQAFDLERTLFVDDNVAVLDSAHAYGITHLLQILAPDSRQAARSPGTYPAVRDFSELEFPPPR